MDLFFSKNLGNWKVYMTIKRTKQPKQSRVLATRSGGVVLTFIRRFRSVTGFCSRTGACVVTDLLAKRLCSSRNLTEQARHHQFCLARNDFQSNNHYQFHF